MVVNTRGKSPPLSPREFRNQNSKEIFHHPAESILHLSLESQESYSLKENSWLGLPHSLNISVLGMLIDLT